MSVDGRGALPHALREQGWRTAAVGGVGWFKKKTPLRMGFEHFDHEPNAVKARDGLIKRLNREPFYGVLNFGTTHRPYNAPNVRDKAHVPKSGTGLNSVYNAGLHHRQVLCLEYLDGIMADVIDWLSTLKLPTVVCFCADHGDCFGEDGCYGHAFYHPKVMEIPLAWSIAAPGGGMRAVDYDVLKEFGLYDRV